jgi:hypothetical protein
MEDIMEDENIKKKRKQRVWDKTKKNFFELIRFTSILTIDKPRKLIFGFSIFQFLI